MIQMDDKGLLEIYREAQRRSDKAPIEVCIENTTSQKIIATVFGGNVNDPSAGGVTTNGFTKSVGSTTLNGVYSDRIRIAYNSANDHYYFADAGTNFVRKVKVTASSVSLVGSINVGLGVTCTTYDAVNGRLLVGTLSGVMFAFNDSDVFINSAVSVGANITDVFYNSVNDRAYLVVQSANNVREVLPTYLLGATIAVGTSPVYMEFNPLNNLFYVLNKTSNNITKFDLSHSVVGTIASGIVAQQTITYVPKDGLMYITNGSTTINKLAITDAITTVVTTGVANYSATLNTIDGNLLLNGNAGAIQQVSIFDIASQTITFQIAEGGASTPWGVMSGGATGTFAYLNSIGIVETVQGGITTVTSALTYSGGDGVPYEQILQETITNPISVTGVRYITTTLAQANEIIKYKKSSSAGANSTGSYNPRTFISAQDGDAVVVDIEFGEMLIFSGKDFLELAIQPNEKVCFYFYNEQFNIADILKDPILFTSCQIPMDAGGNYKPDSSGASEDGRDIEDLPASEQFFLFIGSKVKNIGNRKVRNKMLIPTNTKRKMLKFGRKKK